MRKLILTHLFFLVIAGAFFLYDPYGPNLIWNMFLALISLDFAYLSYFTKNKAILSWISFLGWFLFYPNTFYMLTDIVYFTWASEILTQREALIAFGIFMASILLALVAGVVSLQVIMERYRINHVLSRYVIVFLVSGLSSLGIHVGRFARLNSWDVFTRPTHVLDEILAVLTRESLLFIGIFAFLQIMILLLLDKEQF